MKLFYVYAKQVLQRIQLFNVLYIYIYIILVSTHITLFLICECTEDRILQFNLNFKYWKCDDGCVK
ncbi:hypothetical protein T07_8999 [Trichinella nelsoni]|uniref:Uncharacterized protein n=1 Tax=Trichinella nelsoni TaxID=6336 RepID=A0A0V0S263_9BILA|nr:hypothetical protein T07_8999 [Trichinella nelsoni]